MRLEPVFTEHLGCDVCMLVFYFAADDLDIIILYMLSQKMASHVDVFRLVATDEDVGQFHGSLVVLYHKSGNIPPSMPS